MADKSEERYEATETRDDRHLHSYDYIILCNSRSYMGFYEGLQMNNYFKLKYLKFD